ncbi:hydroxyphenylacetyl-CoA thioesterase PaaI [Nocardioides gansuensis]|nr:hydroxyphenylacetyl-CoA thioesterase PaaI [Nocardioides gansuensis]
MSDAHEVARRSAEAMWSADTASTGLGMVLEQVAPGEARVSMRVRPDMVNGHDLCHGGLVATLADSAFAVACNTYGEVTVASGFEIDLLEPARLGDTLTAQAREVVRRGRSGLYDVTVRRGDTVVAEFRGRSRSLGRPVPGA